MYEDDGSGNGAVEDVLVPISQTNGHRLAATTDEDRVRFYHTNTNCMGQ